MKAVILAGGLGSRLSEETVKIPKPMVTIGGKPIIWHIMKIFAAQGIKDFVVCLGYRPEIIKEYFVNFQILSSDIEVDLGAHAVQILRPDSTDWKVSLIDTGPETETGGRLKRIAPLIGDEAFCMTYGDGVSDVDLDALIAFHRRNGRLATVTGVSPPARFGMIELGQDNETVLSFIEKSDTQGTLINGGFFVLEPGVFNYIDGDTSIWERQPMARLAAEGQISCYRHPGFWKPMDTLRDRKELEELWSTSAPWRIWD